MGNPDSEPKLNGRQINVMLTPHPANKRKPRWLDPDAPKKSEADGEGATSGAGPESDSAEAK